MVVQKFIKVCSNYFIFFRSQTDLFEHFLGRLSLIFEANVFVLHVYARLMLDLVFTGLSVHFDVLVVFDLFLLLVNLDFIQL